MGEIHPQSFIDHRRLEQFRELYQPVHALLGSSRAPENDNGIFSFNQESRGLSNRARITLRRHGQR